MNTRKLRGGLVNLSFELLTVMLLLLPTISYAQIEKRFVRTGQTDIMIQSWEEFGGETTKEKWSGLIEVLVSGFGINVPTSGVMEDAFYPLDPAAAHVPITSPGALPPQGLHISFTGCSATQECGAPRIESYLIFVQGIGFVHPPSTTIEEFLKTIPYSPQHD